MSYVRNAWYVAGWSREIEQKLSRITIMGTNIVIFRQTSGDVVALEDRCPHKLLPLSKGTLVDNKIQCGYHGLTFDGTGKCVRIPGQDNIPKTAFVRSYPTHQKHDIVWIWMGEETKADPKNIFTLEEFDNPQWKAHQGDALYFKSNYLNVAENLVDPAHVSFVHPTTLGNPESEDVKVHTDISGEVLAAWRWIRNAPPVGFFQSFGGFSGNVDRWHYYYLYMPSIAVIDFGSADVCLNLNDNERHKGVRVFAIHFLTPISATECIDRWMHLRNIHTDDEAVAESMNQMFRVAFNEDKEILEAIQEEELRPIQHKNLRLAIDKAPNVYRLRIKRLAEAEDVIS
ncbi:MAG: vanillate O-demethylase oxygenase [Rhodospirillaceae bacterium]|nr:vanillate O-demethylase oxygenase [Rhodospirillaceae bacterium]